MKKSVKRKKVARSWRAVAGFVFIVGIIAAILVYKLGSLTGGLGASETQAVAAKSFQTIARDPLNLPILLLRYASFNLIGAHQAASVRLPGVVLGVIAFVCFSRILRLWYGFKAAVYGSALFGLSAWFLHVSRLASFDVMYLLLLPAIILGAAYLDKHTDNPAAFYAKAAVNALALYIPGALWFVVVNFIWYRGSLAKSWARFSKWWQRLAWMLVFLGGIAPLAISLGRAPALLRAWLGLPARVAPLGTVFKNFADVFSNLFVNGAHTPDLWLGSLPILSFFTSVMFVVGAYFYARNFKAPRSQLLFVYLILGAVLVALAGPVTISLLVPLVYLIAIAGIAYLLREWYDVFPRNPLARRIGLTIVALTVAVTCLYNLQQYFVAWPNNPQTKAYFRKI